MVVVRCTIFVSSIESRAKPGEEETTIPAVAMELFWLSTLNLVGAGSRKRSSYEATETGKEGGMINPGGETRYYCTVCSQCLIFYQTCCSLVLFHSSTLTVF
jgi:hypothetical protein